MARDDAPQHVLSSFAQEDASPECLGFLPPASEADALDWLRLIRSPRIGPVTFLKLLREYKTARAALEALPSRAGEVGLRDYEPASAAVAQEEYEAGKKAGAHLIALGSRRYSSLLAQICDPPPLLWCLGNLDLLNMSCVSIAGARNASALGMRLTRALAKGLGAEGAVVVSGMARGIDKVAHEAALNTGSIGVLAGGVDVIYPRENREIYGQMRNAGLLVSENPLGLQPQARHFPRRNRIIAGLSLGLVIPEAATKSGSLITARDAVAEGREVMAVPGHPFDARAAGCNQLLRDGATLVRNARDVLEALNPITVSNTRDTPASQTAEPPPQSTVGTPPADQVRARLLAHIGAAPVPEDQLIRELGLPAASVTSALVELEMTGRIIRHPGGALSRAS
ncbi:MAG: DNA-processing protein DprA [Dinoroseobacter sp.]|nr:DNA-processing protein DprA [Dinoroseobacter sp.]